MILNISKIKTESLLLFCKDLILSYKDKADVETFDMNDVIVRFDNIALDMLKNIEKVTFSNEYYLENRNHYRIKAILDAYNYLNKEISAELDKDNSFNPSMLYFSLLALWFKELNKESRSKDYIYFTIYPYANVYDEFLVGIKNKEFRNLNIKMIELAEKIILKYDKYSLSK